MPLIEKEYAALKLVCYGISSVYSDGSDDSIVSEIKTELPASSAILFPDVICLDGFFAQNMYVLAKSTLPSSCDAWNLEQFWASVSDMRTPCIVLLNVQPWWTSGRRLPREGSFLLYRRYKVRVHCMYTEVHCILWLVL